MVESIDYTYNHDIWFEIFYYLESNDLKSLRITCKTFQYISDSNYIWNHLIQKIEKPIFIDYPYQLSKGALFEIYRKYQYDYDNFFKFSNYFQFYFSSDALKEISNYQLFQKLNLLAADLKPPYGSRSFMNRFRPILLTSIHKHDEWIFESVLVDDINGYISNYDNYKLLEKVETAWCTYHIYVLESLPKPLILKIIQSKNLPNGIYYHIKVNIYFDQIVNRYF